MPPRTKLWPLDNHSHGKHLVLKRYLNAWFPILCRREKKLLFIDGCAGPGVYEGGEDGSPIIAIKAALEHSDPMVSKVQINFVLIEDDQNRLDNLREVIETSFPNIPPNFKITYINGQFDESLTEILDLVDEQNKNLAPCFAMIDPFGVSDTPMELIQRILRNPKSEVYVSVMHNYINRFMGRSEFEPHLDRLYGTDTWREATTLANYDEKRDFLYSLYKRQLKRVSGGHALHFDLYNGNKHAYAIFFASRALLGMDRMKEAIWKIAPQGDFTFRGDNTANLDLANPDFTGLTQSIVDRFQGAWIKVEEILNFVRSDETDFYSSQVKKNALKVLESKGRITFQDGIKRRKGTFRNDLYILIT